VQVANKFDARITVRRDDEEVNGKSIMGILMLGAEKGSPIVIEAEGDDASAALLELEKIVTNEE
jgi:phosphocarrier protein